MNWQVLIPVILVFVIIIVILLIYSKKNYSSRDQYDERQMMYKTRAYKYAAMTMLFCALIYFLITQFAERSFMEDGVSALLIALAGVAVFAIYSIFTDSFFGIAGKRNGLGNPGFYCILLAVIVIGNGIGAVRMFQEHMLIQNGVLTHNVMNLALAILFLLILTSIGVKYLIDKREDEEA